MDYVAAKNGLKAVKPLEKVRKRPNKAAEGPPGPRQDPKTGRFVLGNAGNGGRKLGTRRDLEMNLVDSVVRHFAENGDAAIERVYREDPSTYLRLAAGLLPRETNINVRSDFGIDSLMARMRELAARAATRIPGHDAGSAPVLDQEPVNGVGDPVRIPARKTSSGDH
jgi:hypothetical protein